jgi:arabinogalactan endo-1,4-beta-galactosidase
MDLGYADMWKSFEKQAKEENWTKEKKQAIAKEIREGTNSEINELAELGVLKTNSSIHPKPKGIGYP